MAEVAQSQRGIIYAALKRYLEEDNADVAIDLMQKNLRQTGNWTSDSLKDYFSCVIERLNLTNDMTAEVNHVVNNFPFERYIDREGAVLKIILMIDDILADIDDEVFDLAV